jgi:proteasome lid subunit RPN8/RPN11
MRRQRRELSRAVGQLISRQCGFQQPLGNQVGKSAVWRGGMAVLPHGQQPTYRPRPDGLAGYHRFANGANGFEAFVKHDALESAVRVAAIAVPDETIGYLVGRSFRDGAGYYAIVESVLVAAEAKRSRTSVESTLEDEKATVRALEQHFPTCEKLGWWHSHPFDMHHYSGTDRENQAFHCSQAFQVGLLVCLVGEQATVHAFHGPDSHQMEEDYKTPTQAHPGRAAAEEPSAPEAKAREVDVDVSPPASRTTIPDLVLFVDFWSDLATDSINLRGG